MNMHARCEHVELADARIRRDPTRTWKLRARMRNEADRRWQVLSQTLRQALIEHDLIGLRGVSHIQGDKTAGFDKWIGEELRQKVLGIDGRWTQPYVQQAADIARQYASAALPVRDGEGPGHPFRGNQYTAGGGFEEWYKSNFKTNFSDLPERAQKTLVAKYERDKPVAVTSPARYTTMADFRDYYGGDNYGSIYAHNALHVDPEQKRVGHLDFSGNNESVLIHHIEVASEHQRKGVATQMIEHLKREFPESRIDWGMQTPEGLKLHQAMKQRGVVRDAGPPDEPRDPQGKWTSEGETPEADKLVVYANSEQENLHEATGYEGEGGIGFLTPKGESIHSMSGGQHEQDANAAGTTLSDLLSEGTARLYADAPFLGIEIHRTPSRAQVRALMRYAQSGSYRRFYIEGSKHDVSLGEDDGPPLKASAIREAIEGATWTRDALVVDARIRESRIDWGMQTPEGLKLHQAMKQRGVTDAAVSSDRIAAMQSLAVSELRGIVAAAQQQITRTVTHCLMASATPTQAANSVSAVIQTMRQRTRAMVEYLVVKTHATATLSAFRAVGVTHVGTTPERLRKRPKVVQTGHGLALKDRRRQVEEDDEFDVITAGDSDVCVDCEDVSDNGPYTLDDAEGMLPLHPYCLPADTLVTARHGVLATSERWYAGQLVVLKTASGRLLSCTPNHPVLTDRGWMAANLLNVGDNVISDGGREWEGSVPVVDNDYQHVPTRIHDVARAFVEPRKMRTVKVPTARPDFHGDGMQGEIAVIRANGQLRNRPVPALPQHLHELDFVRRNIVFETLLAFRSAEKMSVVLAFAKDRFVRCFDLVFALFRRHLFPFQRFRFALASSFDSVFEQDGLYGFSSNLQSDRDGQFGRAVAVQRDNLLGLKPVEFASGQVGGTEHPLNRFPSEAMLAHKIANGETGPVFVDELVDVGKVDFAGHVYNLQTPDGHYSASGIITHNCRCAFTPLSDARFASVHELDARDFNPYHEPGGSPEGGRFASAGTAAGIGGNDPNDPHNSPVSTRVPTEKTKLEPEKGKQPVWKQLVWPPGTPDIHASHDILQIGIESSKEDAASFHKNMDIVRGYDFLRFDKTDDDNTVASKFIAFAKSNILNLYDKTDAAVRKLSKLWYEAAHSYADKLGTDHGVPLRAAAGVIAALSPQKDWDMNADMARRVMDMWQNRKNEKFTDQTEKYAAEYLNKLYDSAYKKNTTEAEKKSRLEDWTTMSGWVEGFKGKSLGDFDKDTTPLKQATLMRWIDEGKNLADPTRANYRVFSPDGTMGDFARNDPTKAQIKAGLPGSPTKIGWQTYKAINNAISILKSPTRANISAALGDAHKVRNFYNNIMYPDDPAGDVTIDTHAIAAATMHPFAGKDTVVAQGLGGAGSKSVKTGAKGLYGFYAEAYRQAAHDRGVLPRQMQSIVWETIRGVWSDSDKRDKAEVARVRDIWKDYASGRTSQQSAQQRTLEKGIADPVWFRRGGSSHDSAWSSIDAGILHDRQLSRYWPRRLDRGDDGRDSIDLALDFDPDQARDPHGRWTASGGGAVTDAGYDPNEPREHGRWTEGAGEVGAEQTGSGYEGSSAAMGEATPTKYTREVDALRGGKVIDDWQQRQALNMYTNGFLFQGDNHQPLPSAEADKLSSLIKQFEAPRDLVLFHRVGWTRNGELEAHVGKDFTDPNFMSASLDPDVTFGKSSYVELHVPKGAAALPVGSLSSYPEEAEVLFPRGSRMCMESATQLPGLKDMKFVARLVS